MRQIVNLVHLMQAPCSATKPIIFSLDYYFTTLFVRTFASRTKSVSFHNFFSAPLFPFASPILIHRCVMLISGFIVTDPKTPDINYVTFIEVLDSIPDQIPLGKNVSLICKTNLTDAIQWTYNGENISDSTMYVYYIIYNRHNTMATT